MNSLLQFRSVAQSIVVVALLGENVSIIKKIVAIHADQVSWDRIELVDLWRGSQNSQTIFGIDQPLD